MGLVRNEIDRLNADLGARGSLTMIFQRGNIKASAFLRLRMPLSSGVTYPGGQWHSLSPRLTPCMCRCDRAPWHMESDLFEIMSSEP